MTLSIDLKPNETHSFDLETHAGGGYLWRVVENDGDLAEVQLKPHTAPYDIHANPIGRSLPVSVEIKALRIGEGTIRLEERRSWEKGGEPLNECIVTIRINQ